jgi:hypothetical protein
VWVLLLNHGSVALTTLCMWFSTVLTIDGIFLPNQGKSLIFTSICSLFSMRHVVLGLNWIARGNPMQSKMRTDAIEYVIHSLFQFEKQRPHLIILIIQLLYFTFSCRYRLLQWTPIVMQLLYDALLAAALRTDVGSREKFSIFAAVRSFLSCCRQLYFDAAALHSSWNSVCSAFCFCCNKSLSTSVVVDVIKSLVPSAAASALNRFDSILPVAAMQPSALWFSSGRLSSHSWPITPPTNLSSCNLLLKMNAILKANWSMVGTESDYDVPAWACPTAAVVKGSFFPLAVLSLSPYSDAREALSLCMSAASKANFTSDDDFDAAVKGV